MAAPKSPSKPTSRSASAGQAPIDANLVRQLADILRDTELTEIEVERGELKIRVARSLAAPAAPQVYAAPAPAASAQAFTPGPAPAAPTAMPSDPAATPPPNGEQVKSPMVGTVYLQATPGSDPFVKPGDMVKAGQTLLIVEAMKTMNPIAAPRDGKVLEILVGDAQPVEYGEALVVLE